MNKTFKVLEIAWLFIGCAGVFMCAYNLIVNDNGTAIYFLVFTVVSGIMYAVRRRQRIKFEETQKTKEQKLQSK